VRVIIAGTFPHERLLHYWAKSTLFGNAIAKKILLNAGCVPVYRNAGNNQELYKGTFDVLAVGEVVAIFPEGTPNLFD
jgi:glycerol-3-phosphate O-acyltransferase / dihydroxyacetone phosphate acyltransferase